MTKNPRRVAVTDLPALIIDLITQIPRTADDLVLLVGYSLTTIRQRLNVLEERHRIHRVAHRNSNNTGVFYTWHAGLAPATVEEPVPDDDPIEVPRRFFATSFPPIGRRDPLVAALFGAPGTRDARVMELER